MHGIDSKLLVAVHFLSKEEQEELVMTTQSRMLIERRREEEGEPGGALLPTGAVGESSVESTFTSVATKVQLFQIFFFLLPFMLLGEDVGKGWILRETRQRWRRSGGGAKVAAG